MGDKATVGTYGCESVGTYSGAASECEGTAKYAIKYDMAWSGRTHPNDYPSAAMFTPMFTFAHSAELTLWRFGETASEPVRLVAEEGDGSGLEMVGEACVADGTCAGLFSPMCVAPDEGSKGVCVAEMDIDVPAAYPYLSSQAMLAPSPDWCAAAHALCVLNMWICTYEPCAWPSVHLNDGLKLSMLRYSDAQVPSPRSLHGSNNHLKPAYRRMHIVLHNVPTYLVLALGCTHM